MSASLGQQIFGTSRPLPVSPPQKNACEPMMYVEVKDNIIYYIYDSQQNFRTSRIPNQKRLLNNIFKDGSENKQNKSKNIKTVSNKNDTNIPKL
jgi:hypothetical protein